MQIISYRTDYKYKQTQTPTGDSKEYEEKKIVPFRLFKPYASSPFIEVFQAEVAFTDAQKPTPVLASYGAGPCIILAGFSSESKAGFLAHFSCYQEVFTSYFKINRIIKSFLEDRRAHVALYLTGGIIGNEISRNTYKTIKNLYLNNNDSKISYSIQLNNPLRSNAEDSKSFSLDTRTGIISTYDPRKDNPLSFRKLTLEDIFWAQNSFENNSELKFIYPKLS